MGGPKVGSSDALTPKLISSTGNMSSPRENIDPHFDLAYSTKPSNTSTLEYSTFLSIISVIWRSLILSNVDAGVPVVLSISRHLLRLLSHRAPLRLHRHFYRVIFFATWEHLSIRTTLWKFFNIIFTYLLFYVIEETVRRHHQLKLSSVASISSFSTISRFHR